MVYHLKVKKPEKGKFILISYINLRVINNPGITS